MQPGCSASSELMTRHSRVGSSRMVLRAMRRGWPGASGKLNAGRWSYCAMACFGRWRWAVCAALTMGDGVDSSDKQADFFV